MSSNRRILAIGDIHGCSRALDVLLAAVLLQPEDQIVTLGDYVDRGPDSSGVIERLLALRKGHQLVALRGNHEQMMLDARQGIEREAEWLLNGGQQTLDSYWPFGDAGRLSDVPDHHWEFLESGCVESYETETHFFVHANACPDLPLAEQPSYMLLWEPFTDPPPHVSGKIMVCGHTAQETGVPLNLGHAICIDTWAHGEGWLTCLDILGGEVWQANQRGQQRKSWIDEYR